MESSLLKIDGKYLNLDLETGKLGVSDVQEFSSHDNKLTEFTIIKAAISLTLNCNLKCPYCYARGGEANYTLSERQVTNFVNLLSEISGPSILLTIGGGEPSLTGELLLKTVRYAKSTLVDPEIVVITNGIMGEKMLDELVEEDVTFHLSFEGLPEINDLERPFPDGSGSSPQVLSVLKKLLEWNPEKVIVRLNVSALKLGREKEIVEFLSGLGVRRAELGWMMPRGRGENYEGVVPYDAGVYFSFLKALEDKGITRPPTSLDVLKWPTCGIGFIRLGLTCDGLLSLCDGIVSVGKNTWVKNIENFVVGEVTDEGAGLDRRKLKAFQEAVSRIPEKCANCGIFPVCKSCVLEMDLGDGKNSFSEDSCDLRKKTMLENIKTHWGSYFKGVKHIEICDRL